EFGANLDVAKVSMEDSEPRLVLEYHNATVAFRAICLAARIFAGIEKMSGPEVDERLQQFRGQSRKGNPDYQVQFLIDYARKYEIPYGRFTPNTRFWQIGWGARAEVFMESSPMADSGNGVAWSRDKVYSKEVFAALGAP